MNWFNPRILVLKDDAETFPLNSVRFVNVSEEVILMQFAGKKGFGIMPGFSKVVPIPATKAQQNLKIGAKTSAGMEMLFDNQIPAEKGRRLSYFFYKPQKKNPVKPVLYTVINEKLPVLPKPPPKE